MCVVQEWVDYFVSCDEFVYDLILEVKGQGENFYYKSFFKRLCNYGEFGLECLSCGEIVMWWYDEEIDYDYVIGEIKILFVLILYFIQIVWKVIREVGMVIVVGYGKLIVVVCYFFVGNIKGLFQENVYFCKQYLVCVIGDVIV